MSVVVIFWILFACFFVVAFGMDVRGSGKAMGVRSALLWTAFWVFAALLYNALIFVFYPQNDFSSERTASLMGFKFLSGYLIEKSLSVDNLFVFIMIFSTMRVPDRYQPRLLKIGILLSIVLRVVFILAGMGLVNRFAWTFYVFGAILIFTAYRMSFEKEEEAVEQSEPSGIVKWIAHFFPMDSRPDPVRYFTRINGKLHITSLFLTLLMIGFTDILFAVDSIPAIIGVIQEGAKESLTIGQENFIAITSNVFAVMGLTSLYFALHGIMKAFRYLKTGVLIILYFIGFKMVLSAIPAVSHFLESYHWISFAVILVSLGGSILISILKPLKENQ